MGHAGIDSTLYYVHASPDFMDGYADLVARAYHGIAPDALSQSTQIRHILARHEQGAGFIAQGMARTDGKPAVCI